MVVRNGFSEKTTSEEIITLCTSSINITKLATAIKVEIVSKKKKKKTSKSQNLLLEMQLIKAFVITSKDLEQWFSVGCTFESSGEL